MATPWKRLYLEDPASTDAKIQVRLLHLLLQQWFYFVVVVAATAEMICMCRGDPHCLTFDGKQLDLSGDCEYTFAQDGCGAVGVPIEDATWSVSAKLMTNPSGSRSWVTAVTVTIDNKVPSTRIH
jgi:hypothetical protein